jgi:hypothetical protein
VPLAASVEFVLSIEELSLCGIEGAVVMAAPAACLTDMVVLQHEQRIEGEQIPVG